MHPTVVCIMRLLLFYLFINRRKPNGSILWFIDLYITSNIALVLADCWIVTVLTLGIHTLQPSLDYWLAGICLCRLFPIMMPTSARTREYFYIHICARFRLWWVLYTFWYLWQHVTLLILTKLNGGERQIHIYSLFVFSSSFSLITASN